MSLRLKPAGVIPYLRGTVIHEAHHHAGDASNTNAEDAILCFNPNKAKQQDDDDDNGGGGGGGTWWPPPNNEDDEEDEEKKNEVSVSLGDVDLVCWGEGYEGSGTTCEEGM